MFILQRRGTPRRVSFLAESIQPHNLGAFARLLRLRGLLAALGSGGNGRRNCNGRWGRGRRQVRRRLIVRGCLGRLECEAELHGGIEETLDRAERNGEPLWN